MKTVFVFPCIPLKFCGLGLQASLWLMVLAINFATGPHFIACFHVHWIREVRRTFRSAWTHSPRYLSCFYPCDLLNGVLLAKVLGARCSLEQGAMLSDSLGPILEKPYSHWVLFLGLPLLLCKSDIQVLSCHPRFVFLSFQRWEWQLLSGDSMTWQMWPKWYVTNRNFVSWDKNGLLGGYCGCFSCFNLPRIEPHGISLIPPSPLPPSQGDSAVCVEWLLCVIHVLICCSWGRPLGIESLVPWLTIVSLVLGVLCHMITS